MNTMNQQVCALIAKTLDARPLLAFIDNLIDKQDAESLHTVLNETLSRPVQELNLDPNSISGELSNHTFFRKDHNVWAAALVGLVRLSTKVTCDYSIKTNGKNEPSSTRMLNIKPGMVDFAKTCAQKWIERFDSEVSDQEKLGESQMQVMYGDLKLDQMKTMSSSVQFVSALFDDVDLYKKSKKIAVGTSGGDQIHLEIKYKSPGVLEERNHLFSFKDEEAENRGSTDAVHSRLKINVLHACMLFDSQNVFLEAASDFSFPFRAALSNSLAGITSFSIHHWLTIQTDPLSKSAMLFALDMPHGQEKATSSPTDLKEHIVNELVVGKYKNAVKDIVDAYPQIIEESSFKLLNQSLYTANIKVLPHVIRHANFQEMNPGDWYPYHHPLYKIIEGYSDGILKKKGQGAEMSSPCGRTISPDLTHTDEALLIVLMEMKKRGVLDQALTTRTTTTGETLGHFSAYASLIKSASFLCKEGLDVDAKDTQGNTMLQYANPNTRDDLAAIIRSTKAFEEAKKITNEIMNGLNLT